MHLLLSNSIHLQAVQVLSLYTPRSARQLRGYKRLYCFCCLVLCTEAAITNCCDLMLILGQNKASLVRLQQACRWCLAWFRFIIFLHNPVGTITLYNTPLYTPILSRYVQYSQSEARFPALFLAIPVGQSISKSLQLVVCFSEAGNPGVTLHCSSVRQDSLPLVVCHSQMHLGSVSPTPSLHHCQWVVAMVHTHQLDEVPTWLQV